jgi:hypothetical protein
VCATSQHAATGTSLGGLSTLRFMSVTWTHEPHLTLVLCCHADRRYGDSWANDTNAPGYLTSFIHNVGGSPW